MPSRPSWLIISWLAVAAWTAVTGVWLSQSVEQEVVSILASREPAQGLPIYAQFIATQTVRLASPVLFSALVIPAFFPEDSAAIVVRLLQDGKALHEWQLRSREAGSGEVILRPPKPFRLADQVEVQFDGSMIMATDKNKAPRLFIEVDDAAYPDGNYRIAANVKQGDISLALFGQRTRLAIVSGRWRQQPADEASKAAMWVVVAITMYALPSLVARTFMLL